MDNIRYYEAVEVHPNVIWKIFINDEDEIEEVLDYDGNVIDDILYREFEDIILEKIYGD